jgi:hypothetical protein
MTSPGEAPDGRARRCLLEEAARLQTNLLADIAAGRPVDPGPVAAATASALAALSFVSSRDARELDPDTRDALRRVHALNGAIVQAIDGALRETGRRLEEVRRASRLASELDSLPDRPRRDWIA